MGSPGSDAAYEQGLIGYQGEERAASRWTRVRHALERLDLTDASLTLLPSTVSGGDGIAALLRWEGAGT